MSPRLGLRTVLVLVVVLVLVLLLRLLQHSLGVGLKIGSGGGRRTYWRPRNGIVTVGAGGVGCDCETCVVLTGETQAMSSWKTNFPAFPRTHLLPMPISSRCKTCALENLD
jgi:hypothetical protein